MGLESATYIADLVVTNPTAGDPKNQGDDHFRLIKTVLQACFPSMSKGWYQPTTLAKSANYTVLSTNMNCTFVSTTSGGAFTYTLPTLAAGDAGWVCYFLKIGSDTNPYFVAPAAGTIQSGAVSGLSKVRRCIPGVRVACLWTGSAWVIERATSTPILTPIHNWQTSLPVGYETPNGATLASASTNYPDFYSANGSSGVLPDITGRAMYGQEASQTRLTAAVSGINGGTKGATGGAESFTLAQTNLPSYTLPNTLGTSHTLDVGGLGGRNSVKGNGAGPGFTSITEGSTGSTQNNVPKECTAWTPSITGSVSITGGVTSGGSGIAKGAVPPGIVIPIIMVVE